MHSSSQETGALPSGALRRLKHWVIKTRKLFGNRLLRTPPGDIFRSSDPEMLHTMPLRANPFTECAVGEPVRPHGGGSRPAGSR